MPDYRSFLESPLAAQWKKIGAHRRAGVLVPLFSLYSRETVGVGEFNDLDKLVDWCRKTGLSLIQLLPLNDAGFHFRPYDSHSSFALDPMHLSLGRVAFVATVKFRKDIDALRSAFPVRPPYFDTAIKGRKLEVLWRMFLARQTKGRTAFKRFAEQNAHWLDAYAQFKVLKYKLAEAGWQDWPAEFRDRQPDAMARLEAEDGQGIEFHKWVQWQLCLQLTEAHEYAAEHGVAIMGDLPFLVSRDSADVWARPDYFKLDLRAGAPPDLLFAGGQEWGMPPYNWEAIAADGYRYLSDKLKYAAAFYDLFRIDHFVGMFRVWAFRDGRGAFDPVDESGWEAHGRRLVSIIAGEKGLLPCAEDLGTVPDCSPLVLKDFAIPGIEIQRWTRDWGKTYDFKGPAAYRPNSIAVLSTHDLSPFTDWWEGEAGLLDESVVRAKCQTHRFSFDELLPKLWERTGLGRLAWEKDVSDTGELARRIGRPEGELGEFIDLYRSTFDEKEKFWAAAGMKGGVSAQSSPALVRSALEAAGRTDSIFSIQLLQDWLAVDPSIRWEGRINYPGTVLETNWRQVLPISLEELLEKPLNATLRDIQALTQRP